MVTFDRGLELMGCLALDHSLGIASYFCDPRSPWQKGAVENANRRLRRYLPSDVAAERRCLGYRTPAQVFSGRLGTAPAEAGPIAAVSH